MPNGEDEEEENQDDNDAGVRAAGGSVGNLNMRGVVVNTRFGQKGVVYVYEGGVTGEQGPLFGSSAQMTRDEAERVAATAAGEINPTNLREEFNRVLEISRDNADEEYTPTFNI